MYIAHDALESCHPHSLPCPRVRPHTLVAHATDEPPSRGAQVTYPATAPELELPELDGKTSKMYRGGKICLTIHFKPLWSKNVPHFGIAHALCLGLGPWMVRSSIRSSPYPNPAHFHPLISHRAASHPNWAAVQEVTQPRRSFMRFGADGSTLSFSHTNQMYFEPSVWTANQLREPISTRNPRVRLTLDTLGHVRRRRFRSLWTRGWWCTRTTRQPKHSIVSYE